MSKLKFQEFLERFPPVEMPITLGEDDHLVFSAENLPIPDFLIAEFIQPIEPEEDDEFTEYVSCFSIAGTEKFEAVVYWKASLLIYEYILATFSKIGQPINRKVIAKTKVTGEKINRAVATIDEELVVFVAEGLAAAKDDSFDPETTKTYNFEILANGEIIQYNAALN